MYEERHIFVGTRRIHARDEHAGDLAGDDVVCYAIADDFRVVFGRQEGQKIMIDALYVDTVLVAVIQAFARDLRKIASAIKPWRRERVGGRSIDAPIRVCGQVACRIERLAAIEEALIVAIPRIAFYRESVRGVGSTLVVALNYFDILELVAGVLDPRITLGVDVRHVAKVVSIKWALAGVVDKAIRAGAIDC